jgi:hypothetical protein
MKELREEFIGIGEVRDFEFTCLKQTDKAYLYKVVSPEFDETHYEVFERKENHQFDCVSYPKSNSFGLWAFTYSKYNKALEKFEDLNSRDKKNLDIELSENEIDESDDETNDEV